MRLLLLWIGGLGAALFGAAFLVSLASPILVEQVAREIVRIEVERRVGERIESLTNSRVVELAQKALGRTEIQLRAEREALVRDVPGRVAHAVADLVRADCECRKRLADAARDSSRGRIGSLEQVSAQLQGLIESAYASVSTQLLREFRIFTGSNALAFALLIGLARCRRAAALQLVLPAIVLLGSVLLTGGFYLFNQNWPHTLVFGQYVGFGYLAYLGGVLALLSDVAFNRARITTGVVNAGLQVLGVVARAVPC